jgi:predicted RNase H-like HicB family nuclease
MARKGKVKKLVQNERQGGGLMQYPVNLTNDDNGPVMARIAGLPGATYGDDAQDALANAVDLLETVLIGLISDREDIPAPEAANGRPTV